ncbi:MAG: hypothetical protein H3C43_02815, partial [Leptonema sp. (in: Bacteria)]|nr:hypothetical protein [Leptonema sp. (in: bacteria)]
MGLFNKTRQIEEAGDSQPESFADKTKPKNSNTGLLSRSEKSIQESIPPKRSGLLERASSALTKKNGLFERASSAFKSQTKKSGLFERASEI